MLPGILNQLGAESLASLKKLATTVSSAGMGGDGSKHTTGDIDEDDDEVPGVLQLLVLRLYAKVIKCLAFNVEIKNYLL